MGLEPGYPVNDRSERKVGNIYDRLDAARRQREQVLATPEPANDDRRAAPPRVTPTKALPKLKPPAPGYAELPEARRWDWIAPWLVGAAIFALIFWFAVR
ncbi:MAG: hypothetical protein ACU0GG_05325 [Paracoccaceae bacterium]